MEHHPVQKPPALIRPATYELMDSRIDDLHGERRCQLRNPGFAVPIDADFEPSPAIP